MHPVVNIEIYSCTLNKRYPEINYKNFACEPYNQEINERSLPICLKYSSTHKL